VSKAPYFRTKAAECDKLADKATTPQLSGCCVRRLTIGDSWLSKSSASDGRPTPILDLVLAPLPYVVQSKSMGEGRLIRVSKFRGDPQAVAYLIAIPDKARATELITQKAANPGDEIEDLGKVSEALIKAMSLGPGEFIPIDGVNHVAQQQQQLQPVKKE
jgi:hypothetical protein